MTILLLAGPLSFESLGHPPRPLDLNAVFDTTLTKER